MIGFNSLKLSNIVFYHLLSREFAGRMKSRVLGPGTTTRLLGPTGREMRLHSLTWFSFWKSPSCRAPELGGLLETLESISTLSHLNTSEIRICLSTGSPNFLLPRWLPQS